MHRGRTTGGRTGPQGECPPVSGRRTCPPTRSRCARCRTPPRPASWFSSPVGPSPCCQLCSGSPSWRGAGSGGSASCSCRRAPSFPCDQRREHLSTRARNCSFKPRIQRRECRSLGCDAKHTANRQACRHEDRPPSFRPNNHHKHTHTHTHNEGRASATHWARSRNGSLPLARSMLSLCAMKASPSPSLSMLL
jgi:hypothetical protein